jgi:predicted pyridoxine 5'-phosphate oxidase superfamily flavin-nucleotide-binding protein
MDFYHDGMRELQDRYEGRTVADRLATNRMRTQFNAADREFIESSPFFFLATSTPQSVDCSFKGGEPGFVRVMGENVVAWPDYDGNRMYRSLGNIAYNPRVGLLFIRMDGKLYNNGSPLFHVGSLRSSLPAIR